MVVEDRKSSSSTRQTHAAAGLRVVTQKKCCREHQAQINDSEEGVVKHTNEPKHYDHSQMMKISIMSRSVVY